jgi:hypothetical protein
MTVDQITNIALLVVAAFGLGGWLGSEQIWRNMTQGKYPVRDYEHWKQLAEWRAQKPKVAEPPEASRE